MKGKVLLTGISGFLGSHTALYLLENGYEVTGMGIKDKDFLYFGTA